jgi:hypothetical protein
MLGARKKGPAALTNGIASIHARDPFLDLCGIFDHNTGGIIGYRNDLVLSIGTLKFP